MCSRDLVVQMRPPKPLYRILRPTREIVKRLATDEPIMLIMYRLVHLVLAMQSLLVVVHRCTLTLLLLLCFRYLSSKPELALGDTKMLLTDQGRSVYRWEGERVLV